MISDLGPANLHRSERMTQQDQTTREKGCHKPKSIVNFSYLTSTPNIVKQFPRHLSNRLPFNSQSWYPVASCACYHKGQEYSSKLTFVYDTPKHLGYKKNLRFKRYVPETVLL